MSRASAAALVAPVDYLLLEREVGRYVVCTGMYRLMFFQFRKMMRSEVEQEI